jgi:hypothetical protein
MLGVVPETAEWHTGPDRLSFGRDQCVNAALLERTVDLPIRVTSIGCDGPDSHPSGGFDFVHLRFDHLSFIRLSGCDRDIENNADFVIDGGVLLVSGLQPSVASVRGHRRVRIGGADLLVLPALPFFFLFLRFLLALVLAQHVLDVPLNETVPADVGADQRRIDVHNLSRGNFRV